MADQRLLNIATGLLCIQYEKERVCRAGEGEGEGLRSGQSFQRILNMLVNETIAFTSLALNMRHRGRLFKIICTSTYVSPLNSLPLMILYCCGQHTHIRLQVAVPFHFWTDNALKAL